jgi:8-hydroxy-5-deazaflavin:NADPH oxidoreductase
MRYGVLGTGAVGQRLAGKLVELDHEVRMGGRSADNERGRGWASDAGERASYGTFSDAASFGEMVLNCTAGAASLEALRAAGPEHLAGKVLIDVSNPLEFSAEGALTLTVCNTDSVGEQIQRELPETRVVKALNTMNNAVMVDPSRVPGSHEAPMAGNDDAAKREVAALLQSFGWPSESIIDLGDISAARGMEMWLPLWLRLFQALGTGDFNLHLARA